MKSDLALLKKQLQQQVIGQDNVVEGLLIALIANGHVLLEGLPGTAKTRTVKALAAAMTVFLLSLTGIPPTAGFLGKWFMLLYQEHCFSYCGRI